MRHGAEVVQNTFGRVRIPHHLTGARRNVQHGVALIAERDDVQRPMGIQRGGHAPLIRLNDLAMLNAPDGEPDFARQTPQPPR